MEGGSETVRQMIALVRAQIAQRERELAELRATEARLSAILTPPQRAPEERAPEPLRQLRTLGDIRGETLYILGREASPLTVDAIAAHLLARGHTYPGGEKKLAQDVYRALFLRRASLAGKLVRAQGTPVRFTLSDDWRALWKEAYPRG